MRFVVPKAISSQLVSQVLTPLGISLKDVNKGVYDGSWYGSGPVVTSVDPAANEPLASVQTASADDLVRCMQRCQAAKKTWQDVPAPKRGEVVRQMRLALEEKASLLGQLVSLEMGKIRSEGVGEVQEYLDICDYAVGLSRQLNGQVIPSERILPLILLQIHV
jgi:aldehyde dehydrogenase family 7 protein A1